MWIDIYTDCIAQVVQQVIKIGFAPRVEILQLVLAGEFWSSCKQNSSSSKTEQ